ncbi:hypothetical protein HGH93_14430 [Chitinophaga polysaccharea]|uniref:hypothetical protein n=1 Tax=Chitinophaga TaxID=79328 RepID=UPI001454F3B2|nr:MULTISPECIES: hypothetical protein [Chitinophaga]NLR59309.1 hypothetical protein [Chitinophaga polysaccharea]NLU91923.1 hypothetical protein [Chitinophaga sp. Ak27]
MKKILIAAAAVGTAVSLAVALYIRKRQQGSGIIDDTRNAMKKTGRKARRFMEDVQEKADGIYSNAMG